MHTTSSSVLEDLRTRILGVESDMLSTADIDDSADRNVSRVSEILREVLFQSVGCKQSILKEIVWLTE